MSEWKPIETIPEKEFVWVLVKYWDNIEDKFFYKLRALGWDDNFQSFYNEDDEYIKFTFDGGKPEYWTPIIKPEIPEVQ